MNNRDYKQFSNGEYYHVYNRGVGKMDIFRDEEDYSNFLKRLKIILGLNEKDLQLASPSKRPSSPKLRPLQIKSLPANSFGVICYCLMPNHFHLLIRQDGDTPVTVLMKKLCTSYSMYFNRKYERVGSLFQGIYKAVNVPDNSYLLWLSSYIHENPNVAALVWDLNRWKWSSYLSYINKVKDSLCDKGIILEQLGPGDTYEKFIDSNRKQSQKQPGIEPYLIDY